MAVIRKRVEAHVDVLIELEIFRSWPGFHEFDPRRINFDFAEPIQHASAVLSRRRQKQESRARHGVQHTRPESQCHVRDFAEIIEAAESEEFRLSGRLRARGRLIGERIVAPERVRKADRLLDVIRIRFARRVEIRIGETVIDRRKSRGARIGQPGDLNRGRFAPINRGRPFDMCIVRSTRMSIASACTWRATSSSVQPAVSRQWSAHPRSRSVTESGRERWNSKKSQTVHGCGWRGAAS